MTQLMADLLGQQTVEKLFGYYDGEFIFSMPKTRKEIVDEGEMMDNKLIAFKHNGNLWKKHADFNQVVVIAKRAAEAIGGTVHHINLIVDLPTRTVIWANGENNSLISSEEFELLRRYADTKKFRLDIVS